jgi:ceramide glucosyltransferase
MSHPLDPVSVLVLVLAAVATAWAALGVLSVARVRLRAGRSTTRLSLLPKVSVLKPLCGVDADLEANLRTFFEQDHPRFELVFGVQGAEDPAVEVVRRLRAAYPSVEARLVVHDGGRGLNPKVSNLRAMLEHAAHCDVVVVSDSNVAVARDYLRELATELARPGTGLVTSPISAEGARTLGAALEALQLNGPIAAAVAIATVVARHTLVVGKSMMFRRSELAGIGGLESVAEVLAEDYVIGRMYLEAGYAVRLARTPVRNIVRSATVRSFSDRMLRWGMIRVRLAPVAFYLEPLASPLVVAIVALATGSFGAWPLVWAVALTLARDAATIALLRGRRGLVALPLVLLRDVIVLGTWFVTPFHRHVSWRGRRVRVSAGTRLYAAEPSAPPAPARIEG